MADFKGQRLAFLISAIALILSIPISLVIAAVSGNYLYALYFIAGLTGVLMVLFGPNWPYLNMNSPKWLPDSAALKSQPAPADSHGPRKRRR